MSEAPQAERAREQPRRERAVAAPAPAPAPVAQRVAPPRAAPAPAPPPVQERAPAPAARSAPEPAPPRPAVAAGDLDIERIQRAWPAVLEMVKKRKISAQAMLHPAAPVGYSDGELVLEFGPKNRFHRDKVSDPGSGYLTPLVEALFETFGVRPAVRCVLGQNETREPAGLSGGSTGGLNGTEEQPGAQRVPGAPKDPIDLIREGFAAEIVEETHG